MGDSWNAYVAYAEKVTAGNIKPVLIEGRLPEGSVPLTEISWRGDEVPAPAKFCEEQARVWRLPDGRVAETGKSWRPLYYVWDSDEDRLAYRRPLDVHTYLHG